MVNWYDASSRPLPASYTRPAPVAPPATQSRLRRSTSMPTATRPASPGTSTEPRPVSTLPR